MKYKHKTIHEKRSAQKLVDDTKEQAAVRFNLSERCARIENMMMLNSSHLINERFWNSLQQDCRKIFVSFYRQSEWAKITSAKAALLEELANKSGDTNKKLVKLKALVAVLEKAK